MKTHFDERALRLLDQSEEIEIETRVPGTHEVHRATLWVVVVASDVYVRSVNGEQGHWYQELSANPAGAIYADEERLPIHAAPVADAELQFKVSEAYLRKYAQYPHDVAWITGAAVLGTTLRLQPDPRGPLS